ncbi:MAG: ribonuclease P protein component [Chloroflexi bacterium]|nr:ribonuclease P protein component [Chloroflexota bacterium]
MGKLQRLTRNADFQQVYKKGLSYLDHLLVMRAMPNGQPVSRFGFSVGRRIGGAVSRNRVKRLLREGIRQEKTKGGWDIVFIARTPVATAGFQQVRFSVHHLLERARIVEHENAGTVVGE